jgi:hypothetical protein
VSSRAAPRVASIAKDFPRAEEERRLCTVRFRTWHSTATSGVADAR